MNENIPPGFIPTDSKVEGIEVYKPAPMESEIMRETVDFNCPQCGATTAFSARDGALTCSHCGYFEAPLKPVVGKSAEDFEFTVDTMELATQGWGEDRKEVECQNCGARTSIPTESLTHTCPFCGSNKVIQRKASQDILRPRFLIPFKVEPSACREITREWLGSSWMTPGKLKDIANMALFTGVYLPYWTFDAITRADWKAEVGHAKTKRYFEDGKWKERIVIEWRWESGHIIQKYDDFLIRGTKRLSDLLLRQINNFNLNELSPYDPKFLAGLQAQAYDVPLETAWEGSRILMRDQTKSACRTQASTNRIRNFSMNLDFADESWRYILLPVYLATYSIDNQEFQVMVNGQTGAIAGQRPVDWRKIWLLIGLLLSPGMLLGLIGILTVALAGIGLAIGIVGFFLLIFGIIISVVVFRQASALDNV
jgi:predicted RNA-binding Zn-ribbon protein involved in translation (DUF1610 family)